MLVDTHCHLDFDRFDSDRDEVIARARRAGVVGIIVPAIDLQNCPAVLRLATIYDELFAAVGVHPNSTAGWEPGWLVSIREWANERKVVAIGEIGLDYYWDDAPPVVQHEAFSAQLQLAAELDLPVIVHNREAGPDVIRLLARSPLAGRDRPGVLHSFSATREIAHAALDMGFYIGVTGPVTFKKADDLRSVVAGLPLDRLLVETDAPFLAPQARRGQRNEPAYVKHVAEKVADLLRLPLLDVMRATTANAQRLFGPRLQLLGEAADGQ